MIQRMFSTPYLHVLSVFTSQSISFIECFCLSLNLIHKSAQEMAKSLQIQSGNVSKSLNSAYDF